MLGSKTPVARLALLACPLLFASCLNHRLIHPREIPTGVVTWEDEVTSGQMLIHLEGAAPVGPGPFPAVLVHPEAGHPARDMRGVIWDLASRGYLAVAVDYRRAIRGKFRRTLFPWRERADATAALEILRNQPAVDRSRLATLGFSQGAVFSLLIAAQAPDIKAIVAYYPVTDFRDWLYERRRGPMRRLVFRIVRWYFRRESGAQNESQFQEELALASPICQAGSIRAPVLLIHGERDRSAPVEESTRLANRLRDLGRPVDLLVVPDAGHVFNFKDAPRAAMAWEATLAWLARHLSDSRATRERAHGREGHVRRWGP